MHLFECVYSPAKHRGPVPGKVGQHRKALEAAEKSKAELLASLSALSDPSKSSTATATATTASSLLHQQQIGQGGLAGQLENVGLRELLLQQGLSSQPGLGATSAAAAAAVAAAAAAPSFGGAPNGGAPTLGTKLSYPMSALENLAAARGGNGLAAMQIDQGPPRKQRAGTDTTQGTTSEAPDTVAANLALLDWDSIEGNRLRAYYRLSVDELFALPFIPTNEEYCAKLGVSERLLPKADLKALQAGRFAELSLGAIVHNEIALGMELCNATVHCLHECVKESADSSYTYEVARAYFLLGTFRAFRGDMVRYFKYRRVCLGHVSKLKVSVRLHPNGLVYRYIVVLPFVLY